MKQFFDFKSFFNFLRRNRLFTAVNIVGFAVSIMFILLLGVYTQQEFAVDAFHPARDRIFRLAHRSFATMAAFSGEDLAGRYPEIERTVTVFGTKTNISVPEKEQFSEDILLADSTFFSVFGYPFAEGSAERAMPTAQDVVLTQGFARKLFGNTPAVGQTVKMFDRDYIVSGVVRDFKNSHLANPAAVVPISNMDHIVPGMRQYAGFAGFTLYIQTRPGADLASRMGEMEEYFKGNQRYYAFFAGFSSEPRLEPLEEIYFSDQKAEYMRSNDRKFISVLAVTALLILIFAVVNYINLSVAQAGFRAKESAIRRLLGGQRWQQVGGFVTESVILCFVSFLIGLGLAMLVQPWFQEVMRTGSSVTDGFTWTNIGWAAAGILVLGLAAGAIPAFVITGFNPIDVVRGTFRRKTKMVYSKVLIAFQYCITIVLVGCTITIVRQVDYMKDSDMGYEKEGILVCRNPVAAELQEGFRDQLLGVPGVAQVGYGSTSPAGGGNYQSFVDDDGNQRTVVQFQGDSIYMQMLGFRVLSTTGLPDADAVWLTQTGWQKLGLPENATEYRSKQMNFKIRGRIGDFHFQDFSQPFKEATVGPLLREQQAGVVLVKIVGGDVPGTVDHIRRIYNQRAGGNLFDGQFLDQRIERMYENQTRLSSILGSLSVLAVIISALGMLAMSTYFIRQRSQEVAVRKVFGASDPEVLRLLMMSFLKLVLVAFVVAVPVVWYLMREWLSGYAYRIGLSWTIFAAAGVLVFVVAVLTILWQLIKAVRTDPAVSLRNQ